MSNENDNRCRSDESYILLKCPNGEKENITHTIRERAGIFVEEIQKSWKECSIKSEQNI